MSLRKFFRRLRHKSRPGIPEHFYDYEPSYKNRLRSADFRIVLMEYKPYGNKIHITLLMAAIPNAKLDVTVTAPGGVTDVSSVVTGEDGVFAYEFAAAEVGSYKLAVSFAGNLAFKAASAEIEVIVYPIPADSKISLAGPSEPVIVGNNVTVSGVFETPEALVEPSA